MAVVKHAVHLHELKEEERPKVLLTIAPDLREDEKKEIAQVF